MSEGRTILTAAAVGGLLWYLTREGEASGPGPKAPQSVQRRNRVIANPFQGGASSKDKTAFRSSYGQGGASTGPGIYGARIPAPAERAGAQVYDDKRAMLVDVQLPQRWGINDPRGGRFEVDEDGLVLIGWNGEADLRPWAPAIASRSASAARDTRDLWAPVSGQLPAGPGSKAFPWVERAADSQEVSGYAGRGAVLGFAQHVRPAGEARDVTAPAILTGPTVDVSTGNVRGSFETAVNFRWLRSPYLVYVGPLGITAFDRRTGRRLNGNPLRGAYLLDRVMGKRYPLTVRPDRVGDSTGSRVAAFARVPGVSTNAGFAGGNMRPGSYMLRNWPNADMTARERRIGDYLRDLTYKRAARVLAWVLAQSPRGVLQPSRLITYQRERTPVDAGPRVLERLGR